MRILIALLLLGLIACNGPAPDREIAISYQADFYTCGEPPNDVLFVCQVGTGPPRQDCTANGSGTTTTAPILC